MKRGLLVGIVCLCLGRELGIAQANYRVYGQGAQSCGTWILRRDEAAKDDRKYFSHAVQISWVLGYVSGAGYMHSETLKKTDSDGITAWMHNYCAAHPVNTISTAAADLVADLAQK